MPHEKITGSNKAHTESVLLSFWGNVCTPKRKGTKEKPLAWHWSEKHPTIREIEIACVGALIGKQAQVFDVHGVLPQSIMPKMDDYEQRAFMAVLLKKLIKQTKLIVHPLKQDIVDWEGSNWRG